MGRQRLLLFDTGARLPRSFLKRGLEIASGLELGGWIKDSGFRCNHFYADRTDLFDAIAREVGEKQTLYLEFGVAGGVSMRMWSKLLKNSASVLHGFDSFIGLPEHWHTKYMANAYPKGYFDRQGQLPQIDDVRVKFFKGWFEEVLPSYSLPTHEVLIVNCDADLYSSTMVVLSKLQSAFRPGDFLYFDEFSSPLDEARAFRSFLERSGMKFSLFGATQGYLGVAFRCAPQHTNRLTE
jgi:hypothetical protein